MNGVWTDCIAFLLWPPASILFASVILPLLLALRQMVEYELCARIMIGFDVTHSIQLLHATVRHITSRWYFGSFSAIPSAQSFDYS